MTLTPALRWAVTLAVALGVVAVPLLPRLVPAQPSDVDVATLLERVRAADATPYEALVETTGTLQLPAADRFDDVGALLGGRSTLRVWWADASSWRVDQLLVAGENDLHHDDGTTLAYSYEDARAEVSRDPDIRLPRTSDLLPAALASRFLDGAGADEVTALDPRRVAGVDAAGLRVVAPAPAPGVPASTIERVDCWVDPATGVALRVEVWADGGDAAATGPAFTSTTEEYAAREPAASTLAFRATPTTEVDGVEVLDIADAADTYAPLRPPAEVAGLTRTSSSRGAVGVYGSGLTQAIAIPLRDSEADPLREQVGVTPGSQRLTHGLVVQAGPLGVAVSGEPGQGAWMVAGTLRPAALDEALGDLLAGTTYREPRED